MQHMETTHLHTERIESNFKQATLSEEDVQISNILSDPRLTRQALLFSVAPTIDERPKLHHPYFAKPRWDTNEEEKNATNKPDRDD